MNTAMWRTALDGRVRLGKDEWSHLDLVSRWLIASRSQVLIMTFISAGIAGLLALRDGKLDVLLWVLVTVGFIMAHAANNLLNDLTDYLRGVDKDNYVRAQYGPHPLEHGFMRPRGLFLYALVTGVIALAAGAYPIYLRGPAALGLLGLGAFFLLFYTWPLKYVGLGELAVLIVWGPLMIGGGYYVITGDWRWDVVVAGLPYALGVTTVLLGKHVDKAMADRAKGIHTLTVVLGERSARFAALGLMGLQYLTVLYLILTGFFTPVLLVVLGALTLGPLVWKVYTSPRPQAKPAEFPAEVWPLWYVAFAFGHNRRFGLLFLLGLVVDTGIRYLSP